MLHSCTEIRQIFTVLAVQQVCVVAACDVEFRNCDSGAHALCRSSEVTPQRGGGDGGWGVRQKVIKGLFSHTPGKCWKIAFLTAQTGSD